MHAIRYTGTTNGDVRWGYRPVARFLEWEMTVGERSTLHGRVIDVDPTALTQPGLTFNIRRPSNTWTWPIEAVSLVGDRISATVGAYQEG